MNKKVVYRIYAPHSGVVRTYNDRKQAKAFVDGLNWGTPEWHYNKLYKMRAEITNCDEICYS